MYCRMIICEAGQALKLFPVCLTLDPVFGENVDS